MGEWIDVAQGQVEEWHRDKARSGLAWHRDR